MYAGICVDPDPDERDRQIQVCLAYGAVRGYHIETVAPGTGGLHDLIGQVRDGRLNVIVASFPHVLQGELLRRVPEVKTLHGRVEFVRDVDLPPLSTTDVGLVARLARQGVSIEAIADALEVDPPAVQEALWRAGLPPGPGTGPGGVSGY